MIDYMKCLKQFLKEDEGLTTVEYAIAGSLVGLAVVGAFTALGTAVGTVITDMEAVLSGGGTGTP